MGVMRRELLLITLLFTIGYTDFAAAQSLAPTAPTSIQKSSQIDLKGLTKKADSGDPQSQFQLGLAYEFGQGVEQDTYAAIRWYRLAANSGDPAAQNNLGYLYQTGPKAVRDLAEASKWYMRSAAYGNPAAQVNLGLLYLRGEGVQKSTEDGLHWIHRAADAEYPMALAALGCIYASGQEVPQDLSTALKKPYATTGLQAKTDRRKRKQCSVKSTNSVKASRLMAENPPHGIAALSTKVTPIPQRDWERCYFTVRESLAICRKPSNCGLGRPPREMPTRNSISLKCIWRVGAFLVTSSKRNRC